MRERFVVDARSPEAVEDLARQVEGAFDRINTEWTQGPYTAKSTFIDRLTDDETMTLESMLEQATPRLRQKFYAVSAFYHRAPDFDVFREQVETAYGPTRAAALLLPG